MRVAVIGSRAFTGEHQVRAAVRGLPPGTVVVSGGAPGPDTWAEQEARACGFEVEVVRPNLTGARGRGPIAGRYYERNRAMVDRSQKVIAFLAGGTGGAVYTVGYARQVGVPVVVYH